MTCSSGTYVRVLCADIGRVIGCGGHLKRLRRTASGGFTLEQAVTLTALEKLAGESRLDGALIPMNKALGHMPTFVAGPDTLQQVAQGQHLTPEKIPRDSIQIPAVQRLADHLKVVDDCSNLKAVLKARSDGTAYDYCCVFH